MITPIQFWFDFSSPYAYFAAIEIEERLSRFGRPIHWRPFILGAAFQLTGMRSITRTPLRGEYAHHDCRRISRMLGVPFVLRDDHPFPSQVVARAFYWFNSKQPADAATFAKTAFAAYFGQGKSLREPQSVLAVAAELTNEMDALAIWLTSETARQELRARTNEALTKGVFGSPFFLANGEPFWGWDRLGMVEAWLNHSDWAETQPNAGLVG